MKGKMHAIDATFDTEPDFVQTNHPQSRSLSIFSFSLHFLIPHICHFLYTGKIFQAKILHPKARKLGQIEFRDKIA